MVFYVRQVLAKPAYLFGVGTLDLKREIHTNQLIRRVVGLKLHHPLNRPGLDLALVELYNQLPTVAGCKNLLTIKPSKAIAGPADITHLQRLIALVHIPNHTLDLLLINGNNTKINSLRLNPKLRTGRCL